MSNQVTIGGDRLGAGGKRKQSLHNFERSTFDQSYLWRSTVSAGTLVPFMNEILLPGDSAEINLDLDVLTSPTLGPLFGSAKCQLDVFQVPVRLYVGALNVNKLNVGNDMYDVHIPQIQLRAYFDGSSQAKAIRTQVNPSSLPAYLGTMGLCSRSSTGEVTRNVNAMPYLAYWDIVKNYYANLQEDRFFYVHNDLDTATSIVTGVANTYITVNGTAYEIQNGTTATKNLYDTDINDELFITTDETESKQFDVDTLKIEAGGDEELLTELYYEWEFSIDGSGRTCVRFYNPNLALFNTLPNTGLDWELTTTTIPLGLTNVAPTLKECALTEIDELLEKVKSNYSGAIVEQSTSGTQMIADLLAKVGNTYSLESAQEGLCVKTYQADLFNNWIQTDWIDGTGGITETTSVDTTGNSFSIDTLNLAQKTYEMLNRIAISGGTYKDWIGAVYSHEARLGVNSPMYLGSLIKELAFQEVVSNAPGTFDGQEQPTGQLAGRGRLTNKNKGGYVKVKPVSEPTLLLGIFSITPRVDYSQGIDWKSDLTTMGELHAPNLDGIGYEDLLTERFAWWNNEFLTASSRTTYSAGKVPAWSNYMTNVNKCFGNFALEDEQMWMTFNRRYEQEDQNIGDLSTYIDPQKFNHIFADTRLDAMNYWVQISNRFITRRKMSAKQIPNL